MQVLLVQPTELTFSFAENEGWVGLGPVPYYIGATCSPCYIWRSTLKRLQRRPTLSGSWAGGLCSSRPYAGLIWWWWMVANLTATRSRPYVYYTRTNAVTQARRAHPARCARAPYVPPTTRRPPAGCNETVFIWFITIDIYYSLYTNFVEEYCVF